MHRDRLAAQQVGHLCGHTVGGHSERLVYVDITLGDASGRVADQCGDHQLRDTEVACGAGEVWRSVCVTSASRAFSQTRSRTRTTPIKYSSPQFDSPALKFAKSAYIP